MENAYVKSTGADDPVFVQVMKRQHPCRQLLDACAGGYRHQDKDVEHVLTVARPSDRAKVRAALLAAAREIADLRASGSLGRARAVAKEKSFELAPLLVEHRPEPGLFEQSTDPRELVAKIPRGPHSIGP